jgi:hypothetical protein
MTTLCSECNSHADYVEVLPAFTVKKPQYKCSKHKPKIKPYELETYCVFMINKLE